MTLQKNVLKNRHRLFVERLSPSMITSKGFFLFKHLTYLSGWQKAFRVRFFGTRGDQQEKTAVLDGQPVTIVSTSMRQISPFALWIGHVGDSHDWHAVFDLGVQAIVDLAGNEPPATPPRELIYCRFPIVDGGNNSDQLLDAAVITLEHFLRANVPVLVYCSAGMSRSPAVAAAALARITGQSLSETLAVIQQSSPTDVSPALWSSLQRDETSRQST